MVTLTWHHPAQHCLSACTCMQGIGSSNLTFQGLREPGQWEVIFEFPQFFDHFFFLPLFLPRFLLDHPFPISSPPTFHFRILIKRQQANKQSTSKQTNKQLSKRPTTRVHFVVGKENRSLHHKLFGLKKSSCHHKLCDLILSQLAEVILSRGQDFDQCFAHVRISKSQALSLAPVFRNQKNKTRKNKLCLATRLRRLRRFCSAAH